MLTREAAAISSRRQGRVKRIAPIAAVGEKKGKDRMIDLPETRDLEFDSDPEKRELLKLKAHREQMLADDEAAGSPRSAKWRAFIQDQIDQINSELGVTE